MTKDSPACNAEKAKNLLDTAERICQQTFGDTPHKLTALVFNNLGAIYDSRNDGPAALSYAALSLAMRQELIDCGKFEEAQEHFRRAIEVYEGAELPSSDILEGGYSCMGKTMLYSNQLVEAEQ
ncbi:hypothetical protein B0T19DRAFT_438268 [Cercophora scortea]|uniref:Tetratricopeptide repeat protein n=1 Tax=Cercophora scortea TaxID=314031 RepID=A0AAE0J6T5_9PEZI|nr:hypothetical protein B0T19DRAFT_438268 [Cercophora scortea]